MCFGRCERLYTFPDHEKAAVATDMAGDDQFFSGFRLQQCVLGQRFKQPRPWTDRAENHIDRYSLCVIPQHRVLVDGTLTRTPGPPSLQKAYPAGSAAVGFP